MKFLILLLLSFSAFAQHRFQVPSDKSVLRSLSNCKQNHMIILSTYRSQIDSEIGRLFDGIEYENDRPARIAAMREFLIDLTIKRIFVSQLIDQLKPIDLDKMRGKRVFSENFKVDLQKEIGIHLDQVAQIENFGDAALKEMKYQLGKELLKSTAIHAYKAIGGGILARIAVSGVSSAALKSAVVSIGSEAFASAGTLTLVTLLTLPLHAYRLPPETVWTDILEKNPEMILNPEWMRYAGSHDEPWYSHAYAILRRTNHMEEALQKVLDKEEAEFQMRAASIVNLQESRKEKDQYEDLLRAKVDNTYVYRPRPRDIAPFWAHRNK